VNAWWWVPIGLAAWCVVAVVMALCTGPVLRRASQARESLDRQVMELSDGDAPYTSKQTRPDYVTDNHEAGSSRTS
jgi:hypothetical protein